MSSQNKRKNREQFPNRAKSANGNGHSNAHVTSNPPNASDLKNLLQSIRNGEISSDEALLLYRNSGPDISRSNTGIIYCSSAWLPTPPVHLSAHGASGPCLVFDTDEGLLSGLADTEAVSPVIGIQRGESYEQIDERHFKINATCKEDYERLLSTLKTQGLSPAQAINLWPFADPDTVHSADRWFAQALYPILYLGQALLKQKPSAGTTLLHLFPHTHANQQALHSAISGFARSLHLENPHLVCRAVEVDASSGLLEVVNRELTENSLDQAQVRYKHGDRFVNRLVEIKLAQEQQKVFIRENGVYLVTGGLGALGVIFAEHLASKANIKLVLTGRTPLTSEAELSIRQLEALGAEVIYWQTDVADHESVSELINGIRSRFGHIHGVIHSAGIIRDGLVFKKSADSVEAVLAPKIAGAVYLDEALKDEQLDFFVLFSSLVALTGNPGQADYAYANSFLDHFAALRERLRAEDKRYGRTLSINWPLWRDGGMAVSEEAKSHAEKLSGIVPLDTEDGIQAFEWALNSEQSHVLVLPGDAEKMRRAYLIDSQSSQIYREAPDPTAPVTEEERKQLQQAAEDFLKSVLSREVKLPVSKLHSDQPLEKYGIDSMMIMNVTHDLEESFGTLPKTLFFEYQNIEELAQHFVENHAAQLSELISKNSPQQTPNTHKESSVDGSARQFLLEAAKNGNGKPASNGNGNGHGHSNGNGKHHVIKQAALPTRTHHEDIAIIGVAGRYPGAETPEEFWENLKSGKDSITEIPSDRWALDSFFDPDKEKSGRSYNKWGGFIDDVDKFDPLFFNISPREAELMDPQERLFLETAWQTFEDAGYTRASLSSQKAGVFVGVMYAQYQLFAAEETLKGNPVAPGNFFASIANRVSYFFNLHGPSIALDTLCSSSLTAIHLACESIQRGEIDIALAGGVNVTIHPSKYFNLSTGKFASSDGRCRSFGEGGDGYVPGEGVGAILLKPLSKAIADGDYIYAVIKKTSINHGGKTNGVTVPNPKAQSELIAETLTSAGIDSRTISYIEAHGTGTALGDPIEIAGLTKAFRKVTSKQYSHDTQYCAIGSVKSNVGHLESAAGIAGITKVLMQMKHGQIAPSLHSASLNPNIDFESSPFYVQRELSYWTRPVLRKDDEALIIPRLAGVSSFGAGGANAHIILEEYAQPVSETENHSETSQLVILSARNQDRLRTYAAKLSRFLKQPAIDDDSDFLANLAFTLQVGREHMQQRLAVVVSSTGELIEHLDQYVRGDESTRIYCGNSSNSHPGWSTEGALIESRDLEKLAEVWVVGAEINWAEFQESSGIRRIPLPTYPFARERYWLPTAAKTVDVKKQLHPLIDENTSDLEEQKFTTHFTGNEFFLTDHVIKNRKLLPGVVVLEMVRAAGELAGNRPVLRITDTTWISPIVFAADGKNEINISLYPVDDNAEYEVWSPRHDGSREVHAEGKVLFDGDIPNEKLLDLNAVLAHCPDSITGEESYRQFEEHGFSYGRSFRSIQELHFNPTEAIARLQLPAEVAGEFHRFTYHPSLLDGALQSVLGLLRRPENHNGQVYVPFALGTIEQYRPLTTNVFAHVKRTNESGSEEAHQFDIFVVDESGALLLRLKDFVVKELGSQIRKQSGETQPSECLLYYPHWKESPLTDQGTTESTTGRPEAVLIFDTTDEIRNALAQAVSEAIRPILIKCGNNFADLGNDTYVINPLSKSDYQQLLSELKKQELSPNRILHLWSWRDNSADVSQQLDFGFRSVFNLTQALMEQRSDGDVRLLYVHPEGQPAFAAVSALSKTIRLENPKFHYRSLVLNQAELGPQVKTIVVEFQNGSDGEVRYENHQRQVKSWSEFKSGSDSQTVAIKDDGVYVITGGAGGLGLIFAEYLAGQTNVRLVLTGRSKLTPDKEAKLRTLDSSGERITYLQADVSNCEEVESLIARVKARFGVINGVIHAAGVTRDAFVLKKCDAEIAAVLAPKVYGTKWLDEATAGEQLDFFVIFSSAAGALGNIGQSDYAYANSFADHFALQREGLRKQGKRSGKTLSLDWPLWEAGGLQTSESSRIRMRQTMGLVPLTTEDGLNAFELALQSQHAQLMVLAGERSKISRTINPAEAVAERKESRSAETTLQADDEVVQQIDSYLKRILSNELKLHVDKISSREPLEEYGIDSVIVMNMTRELEKKFGELSKTLFFEYRTIAELTRYFINQHRTAVEELSDRRIERVAEDTQISGSQQSLAVKRTRFQKSEARQIRKSSEHEDIAIIGISGRYPMANDLEEFWENLKNGQDCITEVPADRWSSNRGKQWGGFIDDVDKFDSLFFNISPKEAKLMDPQERLFLETVWHTIEDAGYSRRHLETTTTGVFVGVMYGHYQLFSVEDSYKGTGYTPSSLHASIANRISYVFNFHGPSIALDTMCSSSLTAIHLACASLRQGECEVAIAGGVNVSIHQNKYIALSEAKFTATDGRCRTFGAGGDGYVPGEGVGALMLKPVSKAVVDGDHVYGVIKGSAINHGGRTNGYTVPNPTAQAAVIAQVLKQAKIDPRRISYLEAHGTGTSLGDPIEITGLIKAFSETGTKDGSEDQYCSIGSVKSNIGHLESAAGIAGITKVLLQMRHRQLVPSLHSAQLNPHINFNSSPFYVQQTLEPWKPSRLPGNDREYPRQAGISSFGAGGSNAHLVIEEFVGAGPVTLPTTEPQFITLSARNAERLKVYAGRLAEFLNEESHPSESSHQIDDAVSAQIEAEVSSIASGILNLDLDEIDPAEVLSAYGADPVCINTLTEALNQRYDVELSPSAFHVFPSLRAVAQYLVNEHGPKVQKHYSPQAEFEVETLAPELNLADLAYTLQLGREEMEERLALVVRSVSELAAKLTLYAQGEQNLEGVYAGNVRRSKQPSEVLLDGKEGVEFIQAVIAQRKWHKLAQLWLMGIEIDWRLLHVSTDGAPQKRRRISLPTYPFARIRQWLPAANAVQSKSINNLHPLIDGVDAHQILRQHRRIVFRKVLRGNDRVIKDHAVLNRTILPGVGYLEMAHAALSQIYDSGEFQLARIVLLRPLVVSDEVCTQVVITEENGLLKFEIQSGDNEPHARGEYRLNTESNEEISPQSIEAIKSRCRNEIRKEELYEQFKAVGIEYGPYYQRIEEVWGADDEALGLLSLPREYQHELSEYCIHPTLLDAALQVIAGITINRRERDNLVLPFAIERVEVVRPLTARVYAHVKLIEQDRYDVTVLNEDGQVCVRLHELALKSAKPKDELPEFFYLPAWKPAPLAITDLQPATSPKTVLVFHGPDSSGLEESLNILHERDNLVWARLGSETKQISDREWVIDTSDSDSLDSWLKRFQSFDELYFLGGIQAGEINIADLRALEETQNHGVLSLFRLVKSLIRLGVHRQALRLKVITSDAHEVLPGDVVNPYAAGLFGLVKSLAKEHPLWSITSVDISLAERSIQTNLLKAIADEPSNANGDEVALRQGQRYVRSLTPVSLPTTRTTPFREEGVYLILGGAGGIGLELSKYLARSVRARLILVGRRALNDDQRRQITEIESLGGEVLYLQGDATDLASMQSVFAEGRRRFGTIHGVIHSAIVLKDKTIANLTEEEFRAALQPKVQGSVNLYLAAANESLDFMLFFSSAQSFSGNAGQSNYAAGCTFKDSFAQYLRQVVPYDVKTINWGYWGEVGVVSSAEYNRRLAAQGVGSISTSEGVEAVRRVLAYSIDQVMPIKLEKHLLEAMGVDLKHTVTLFPNNNSSVFEIVERNREVSTDIEQFARSREAFNEVASFGRDLLLSAFQEMGAFRSTTENYRRDDLRQKLRVAPNYHRLFDALLEILRRARFIRIDGQTITGTPKLQEQELRNRLSALPDKKEQITGGFPEVSPHVELLWTCYQQTSAILRGETRATDVMFPDSSTRLVEGVYRGNPVADRCNQHVAGSVRSFIESRLPELRTNEKIKIIEVGAGTGGTSTAVLNAISSYADKIQYLYTDVSAGFIQHGKRHFGPTYPFVEFKVLDVENEMESQGFAAGEFDIVLGANVLHATRNLRNTIRNVKRLLKTNGWVVLNEVTEVQDFTTLTFGLLDGWWLFDDPELRLSGAPLLSPSLWTRLLKEEGFKAVYTSGNADDEDLGQHVIIAESNGQTIQLSTSRDKQLLTTSSPQRSRNTSAPPQPAPAVNTPPAQHEVTPIDPDDVLAHIRETILQCVADALSMSVSEIDHDRQFSEYGVDSIIGVDLINVINSALGLTLRTTALFDYGNVKELAQFIYNEHSEQLAVSSKSAESENNVDLALLEKLANGELASEQVYQILETHYGQL